ncbi:MAG: hypothetical protein HYU77_08370 [Betaproteobacteria bacterium]|nr:hypothetical protein [Betaproteobacteria bacterium]
MLEQRVVFLDLETTGAAAGFDRVTEIGIVEVNGGKLASEWGTLVNPETRIPPAIETLTGITNAMVRDAPTFSDLAQDLMERLAGRLLVAHNARFDYGFLKNEFKRAGLRYASKVLCTVKLSRRLYPEHHRHNLDSLIERHGLICEDRHRALGDARVLWQFVQTLSREKTRAEIDAAVEALLRTPSLPAGLAEGVLDDIPETPGVYLFYGENDIPLYVGKSVNLRSRVLAHFSGDHAVHKDMRISRQITRVEWIETVGELGALMREARLVKQLQPVHNRWLRRSNDLCAWRFDPAGDAAKPLLVYARDEDFGDLQHLYGLFRAKREAVNTLRAIAEEQGLCPIVLGLESGKGPCFAHQLKKCRGACVGKENTLTHSARLLAALHKLRVRAWPFRGRVGIRETDSWSGKSELHVLDRWCYLGTVRSDWELFDAGELGSEKLFDLDTYKILTRYFERHGGRLQVVELDGTGGAAGRH